MRDAGSRCNFHDLAKEIKHQIVFSCVSRKLRRKALSEDLALEALTKYARFMDKTQTQTTIIAKKTSTKVSTKSSQGSTASNMKKSRLRRLIKKMTKRMFSQRGKQGRATFVVVIIPIQGDVHPARRTVKSAIRVTQPIISPKYARAKKKSTK